MNVKLLLILLMVLLSSCSSASTIEDALKKAKVEYKSILYSAQVDNGLLVFYEHSSTEIGLGFIGKNGKKFTWSNGGGHFIIHPNSENDFKWVFVTGKIKDKHIPVYYGVVRNPNIKKIEAELIEKSNVIMKKELELIQTKSGGLWYIIPPYTIKNENLTLTIRETY